MYYTPKNIIEIIDPASGSGLFLSHAIDVISNPPYSGQRPKMSLINKIFIIILHLLGKR